VGETYGTFLIYGHRPMVGYRSPKPLIRVRVLVPVQNIIMSSLIEFLKESYTEFTTKVEWPKWSELQSSTIVVAIASVLLAMFTFGVDSAFSASIKNIVGSLINLFH
jgi:preprotein translocase subunit SecE